MTREQEQEQRLAELLTLMVRGLNNGRLRLATGWDAFVKFDGEHMARAFLDLRFDVPAAGMTMTATPSPQGGSSGDACRADDIDAICVAGVDVMADRMSVTIYGDGSGQALPPVAPVLRTSPGRVASPQQATPPMGPPAVGSHGGNSAPAAASVRGLQKSERSGERLRSEVNECASARGAE